MWKRRLLIPMSLLGFALILGILVHGQTNSRDSLAPEALREWLTVLSSDEMEGRATFSPGLDKAAAYIADRLKQAGVKPAGDEGSYLQHVAVQTVQATNQSTLTVEVNGQSRVFRNGEGVDFPGNVGGKRTFTLSEIEFVGYGLISAEPTMTTPAATCAERPWFGWASQPPHPCKGHRLRVCLGSRSSTAIEEMNAAASLSGNRRTSWRCGTRRRLQQFYDNPEARFAESPGRHGVR